MTSAPSISRAFTEAASDTHDPLGRDDAVPHVLPHDGARPDHGVAHRDARLYARVRADDDAWADRGAGAHDGARLDATGSGDARGGIDPRARLDAEQGSRRVRN